MLGPRDILKAAARYVRKNPHSIVKVAVDAANLRFGIPVEALRWAAAQAPQSRKAPKDIYIDAAPPALRFGATVDAMGTALRVSAAIRIDEVTLSQSSMRIGIRLNEVKLTLIGESDAPIATLVKSGALDLSKPGNLVKVLPKKPPAIIEAHDDRIVVDLLRIPSLQNSSIVRRFLSVVTPVLGIRAIETDGEHLYISLRATVGGIPEALAALRID
jgi:hypothetical protein